MGTTVYTHGHTASVLRSHKWRNVANSCAYFLPHLREDMRILDLGCGPGTISLGLAALVPRGSVLAIDNSPQVIATARELAADSGQTNIRFEVGDATSLDFPDASFDVVQAHQLLQHVANPVGVMKEMRRVCRPSGLVVARDGDFEKMTWYPEEPLLARWVEIYRAVARSNRGEPDAARYLWAWARAAGFTDIVPTASAWCFATDEERGWWAEVWADRISTTRLADQAVELGLADREELTAIAAALRHWSTQPDGCFLVLQGEVLCRP